MADPATQSPYISSSAGGGFSEPGGRDLKGAGSPQSCADTFVSSSQPVSLSSTSQAGVYLTHSGNQRETNSKSTPSNVQQEVLGGQRQGSVQGSNEGSRIETISVGSPYVMELPFSVGSKVHTHGPVMETTSLEESVFKGVGPLKGKTDLNGCNQEKERASNGESKFALLTNPEGELEQAPSEIINSHSIASSGVAVEAPVEKDSPESPFEVIADKLEFDKEFKDVLTSNSKDISSNWVIHSERELLTDIPEDSICEFQAKPRGSGRIPSGPGLSRQSSGTTAALEEVSKCVREMHSFTNELLNWDLIPKDLDDKADDFINSGFKASPTETSGVVPGPTVSPSSMEASKASAPHQLLTISLHQKGKPSLKVEETQAIVSQGVAVVKSAPPVAIQMKTDVSWPNPGLLETTDADSSGESDDTVIEDAPADLAFLNKNSVENCRALPKPTGSSETEIVYIGDGETSDELQKSSRKGQMASQALECHERSTDDFKAVQAETDAVRGGPSPAPQPSKEPSPETPSKARQVLDACELELPRKTPKTEDSPRSITLGSLKEMVRPDGLSRESFMDFTKECLKSKGGESPVDPVEMFSEAELKAARSQGMASYFQQPPQAKQDFEHEQLTITALKEAGRKAEMERPAATLFSPPRGGHSGQHCEILPDAAASAPKSALEKRPLCLGQAIDVKLVPASVGLGKTSQILPPEPSVPHAITKLLAEFSVRDLIFWRDVKKTGAVFSTTLILLLSLAAFSVISVVSYLVLALLSVTICFRVYKSVIQAVQKSEEGHPFKAYLDKDITLSSETFHNYVSSAMVHVNHILKAVLRLFLVEDLVDSLKLAVVMWLMTYVGAIFNGITLLILGELLVFSVPVVYEKYKTQIDHYVGIIRDRVKSAVTKIQAKLPGTMKKKAE
ncbi:reticulon-3 isoform X2 [Candoia aspera]|uniref:reticulon-3 isoform X2 n=1 Tax=Candoia aspera TaxID=51853 RepID=UPI002FD7E6BA